MQVVTKDRVGRNVFPGSAKAVALFHFAAKSVPAYKDFLQKNHVDPATIMSAADFVRVPLMTKDNYLRKYPLADVQVHGDFSKSDIISMSSGSSGVPFIWPRGTKSEQESIAILDDLFARVFQTKQKTTLCIIAYAMGTWIAGTYMLSAMNGLTHRGHRIVSVTPGINIAEIGQIIEKVGNQFDQVLIMGYPPFIKDAVENVLELGVDLASHNIKFLFSSEHISEVWRDYVLDKVQPGYSPYNSLCLYGAADTGIIGMETPLLIKARRIIAKHPDLFSKIFPGTSILPTIVNYNSSLRYVEQVGQGLVITMNNSIPLIRYDLRDQGRVMTERELLTSVRKKEAIDRSEIDGPVWPVIALYGRVDVPAMFYGVNIYPENIKLAVDLPELQTDLTGKFAIQTQVRQIDQEQELHIYLEMRPNTQSSQQLSLEMTTVIVTALQQANSEFRRLYEVLGKRAEPIIHLIPKESNLFVATGKHKWVLPS